RSRLHNADMVFALPTAEISVMEPASAVAFLWNDKITEDVSRADLVEKWKKTVAAPEAAAADGSIDDVIDAAELRQRVCAAVYMLMAKSAGAPARKHCNLPL
ncbi:MAG: carboxyl transferase, partial [Ruminococcaceae bacterium]|nr:carboxyl transferase [Oscillospiraceae bacterium]